MICLKGCTTKGLYKQGYTVHNNFIGLLAIIWSFCFVYISILQGQLYNNLYPVTMSSTGCTTMRRRRELSWLTLRNSFRYRVTLNGSHFIRLPKKGRHHQKQGCFWVVRTTMRPQLLVRKLPLFDFSSFRSREIVYPKIGCYNFGGTRKNVNFGTDKLFFNIMGF